MQKFSSFGRKKKQTKIRHRMVMLRRLQLWKIITLTIHSKCKQHNESKAPMGQLANRAENSCCRSLFANISEMFALIKSSPVSLLPNSCLVTKLFFVIAMKACCLLCCKIADFIEIPVKREQAPKDRSIQTSLKKYQWKRHQVPKYKLIQRKWGLWWKSFSKDRVVFYLPGQSLM